MRARGLALLIAAPAILLALLVPALASEPSPPPLTLDDVLAAARAGNPTLRAARLREPVDRANVDVARELPNPEARYERSKDTPRDTIGLTQLILVPGKRWRRIEAARAAALTGRAEIAEIEAEVADQARRAFYALAAAQRRSASSVELLDLARRARAAAEARLEAGEVSQLDASQAEVAFLQAENEAASQAGSRAGATAELNVLIGRDAAAATEVSDAIDAAPPQDRDGGLQALETGNSALALLDRQIAEAQARAALARAERWPDPSLEAALTHGAEPDFTWGWRFSVGIAVPLFTTHGALVRVEEATLAQRRAERQALAERARGAVFAALARARAQHQRYLRFRDEILPRNRQVEEMAEEAYRVGQTPLTALLQSLTAARELRAQALAAASEYQSALADLEQAVVLGGKP